MYKFRLILLHIAGILFTSGIILGLITQDFWIFTILDIVGIFYVNKAIINLKNEY